MSVDLYNSIQVHSCCYSGITKNTSPLSLNFLRFGFLFLAAHMCVDYCKCDKSTNYYVIIQLFASQSLLFYNQ